MISIIIPAYHPKKEFEVMTERCLESLASYTPDDYELILQVDPSGEGYAKTVNKGLFKSKGDVLVISNNDILFTPGWLTAILKPLNEGYDISSIITSDQTWKTENKITEGDKFGSLWAMKRKVYKTIGGLDESFGNYFEDLDYKKRAEAVGFKIGKNHAHLVEHLGKATFKEIDPEDKFYQKAMQKYKQKWGQIE